MCIDSAPRPRRTWRRIALFALLIGSAAGVHAAAPIATVHRQVTERLVTVMFMDGEVEPAIALQRANLQRPTDEEQLVAELLERGQRLVQKLRASGKTTEAQEWERAVSASLGRSETVPGPDPRLPDDGAAPAASAPKSQAAAPAAGDDQLRQGRRQGARAPVEPPPPASVLPPPLMQPAPPTVARRETRAAGAPTPTAPPQQPVALPGNPPSGDDSSSQVSGGPPPDAALGPTSLPPTAIAAQSREDAGQEADSGPADPAGHAVRPGTDGRDPTGVHLAAARRLAERRARYLQRIEEQERARAAESAADTVVAAPAMIPLAPVDAPVTSGPASSEVPAAAQAAPIGNPATTPASPARVRTAALNPQAATPDHLRQPPSEDVARATPTPVARPTTAPAVAAPVRIDPQTGRPITGPQETVPTIQRAAAPSRSDPIGQLPIPTMALEPVSPPPAPAVTLPQPAAPATVSGQATPSGQTTTNRPPTTTRPAVLPPPVRPEAPPIARAAGPAPMPPRERGRILRAAPGNMPSSTEPGPLPNPTAILPAQPMTVAAPPSAAARPATAIIRPVAPPDIAPPPVAPIPPPPAAPERLSKPLFPTAAPPAPPRDQAAPDGQREDGHAVAISAAVPNRLRGLTDVRVSLNFRDADIADIARIIAEKAGLNIVSRRPIVGRTTVRLDEIPVGTALDIILKGNDYSYEIRDGIVWVLQRGDEPSETMIFFIKHVRAADLLNLVKYSLEQDDGGVTTPGSVPEPGSGQSGPGAISPTGPYGPPAPPPVSVLPAGRNHRWTVMLEDRSNALVVTAARWKLEEIARMVAAMDFDRGGAVTAGPPEERIFKLKYIDKETLVKAIRLTLPNFDPDRQIVDIKARTK